MISSVNVTRIWSHLLKKSLMENFIFVQCNVYHYKCTFYRLLTYLICVREMVHGDI